MEIAALKADLQERLTLRTNERKAALEFARAVGVQLL
jgi:hypothetical protein